tara:strand:- start:656 stop:1009 length:354 start_codon:yes stop_codon:yes gene_type:complete
MAELRTLQRERRMKVPYNHPDGAWNPANMRKQLRAKAEEDRRFMKQMIEEERVIPKEERVCNYIRANREASPQQVAEVTGATPKFVRKMFARIYSPNKRDIEKILDEAFKKVFGGQN